MTLCNLIGGPELWRCHGCGRDWRGSDPRRITRRCQPERMPPVRAMESLRALAMGSVHRTPPVGTRNLLYHVMPTDSPMIAWNIAQLLRRMDQFNGLRQVAIVTGPGLLPPETVQTAFGDARIDRWHVLPNDPDRREGATFAPMLEAVRGLGGDSFFGHAKGVTRCTPEIKTWAAVMYAALLDRLDKLSPLLQSHRFVGMLRRRGTYKPVTAPWHYSGTFWWFRDPAEFTRHGTHEVESWPGHVCPIEQAACIIGDGCGCPYRPNLWSSLYSEIVEWIAN